MIPVVVFSMVRHEAWEGDCLSHCYPLLVTSRWLPRVALGSSVSPSATHPLFPTEPLQAVVMTLMLHHNPGCIKSLFLRSGEQGSPVQQEHFWDELVVRTVHSLPVAKYVDSTVSPVGPVSDRYSQ